MTTADGQTRALVALQVGDRRLDVAVPYSLPLYEALRSLDVDLDDPRLVVVDSSGHALDLYGTRGDALADGAVLHVLRQAVPSVRARTGHAAGEPAASRPTGPWWWVLAATSGVVLVAGALLSTGDGRWLGGAARVALAVLLLLTALLTTVARGRRVADRATVAGWATAGAAGAVVVEPGMAGAPRLAVVMALVAATGVTAVRWALTRRDRDPGADLALVLLVWTAAAAGLTAGTLLAGLPAVVAAAVLLGLLPVALRALPSLAVDVPDEQLLDLTLVERTVSTVRRPQHRPLGPVNARAVRRTVEAAERRRDAGTVVVGVLAPVLAGALLLQSPAGTLPQVAAAVACALVAMALLLHPRTARGAVVRWAPRVGALLVLALLLVALSGAAVPATVLATVVVALGLLWALVALPLGQGWRSVGASRAGDVLEGLATALALPVALVGAGTVELLRLATSG